MTDLNAIARELGELGREEADLHHTSPRTPGAIALQRNHQRRCELLNELLAHMVATGQVDEAVAQAAAQKKPPPNPGGGG